MVAIYLTKQVQSDGYGTYGSDSLFRIYDADEVPDDLEDRVQNWANTLYQRFEIRDYRDKSALKTVWVRPQEN